MSFNNPYQQQNYLGEHVDDAAVLAFIRSVKWDSLEDGTGLPREGMLYYNVTTHRLLTYLDGAWQIVTSKTASTISHLYNVNVGAENTGTSYKLLTSFIYGGSDNWGTITAIRILANTYSGSTGSARIYDAYNLQNIAEITGVTDLILTPNDMGAISNIPTTQALFEVHGNKIYIQEVVMEF